MNAPEKQPYVRYGAEWEREVMKNPKKAIVEMLRRVAKERDELTQQLNEAREMQDERQD